MSFLRPAVLLAACLLVAAPASADTGVEAPPSTGALPAAPPPAPLAPASPPPALSPAYPTAYTVFPALPPGAPRPYWTPVALPTERRSDAMRTAGIVLFAVGGVTTGVGAGMFFPGALSGCPQSAGLEGDVTSRAPAASSERIRSAHQALTGGCMTTAIAGIGVLTAGLLTSVVGIPLFVIGSKRVPAPTTADKLVPQVSLGVGNGSLRWTF
jgi:hypothetical protein